MLYRKSVFYSYVIKNLDKTVKTENDRGIERILVFYTSFNRTLYCDWCDRAGVTLFHRGLPETEDQLKAPLPAHNEVTLVVVDDLEVSIIFGGWLLSSVRCYRIKRFSEVLFKMFTVWSHHWNFSILYAQHSIFGLKTKHSTLINRNATHLALMPNRRDRAGIQRLGYQIYPRDSHLLLQAFDEATSAGIGSRLIVDFTPSTPEKYRYFFSLQLLNQV